MVVSEPTSSQETKTRQPVGNSDVITLIEKPKNSLYMRSKTDDTLTIHSNSLNSNDNTEDGDVRIKVYPEQMVAYEGSKTAFSCIVTEGLPVTIDWVLNGKLVKDQVIENVHMETIHTAGNLVFKKLSTTHNNSYIQCRVLFSNSNMYSLSQSINLLVQGNSLNATSLLIYR